MVVSFASPTTGRLGELPLTILCIDSNISSTVSTVGWESAGKFKMSKYTIFDFNHTPW